MSYERYDYGPLRTYEITWRTGHIETVRAHQVLWPNDLLNVLAPVATAQHMARRRVLISGMFEDRWRLVLAADEDEIYSIRDVTADEPVPTDRDAP